MKKLWICNDLEKLEDLIHYLGLLIKDLELENTRLRRELRKHQMKQVRRAFLDQQSNLLM
ncbi:MAG: hypothetical protein GTO14_12975 [Anaerolineales bacterium]|nr:hypothetical protein [Anaerolineales bacterium]